VRTHNGVPLGTVTARADTGMSNAQIRLNANITEFLVGMVICVRKFNYWIRLRLNFLRQ
jgi:hypothetical protein